MTTRVRALAHLRSASEPVASVDVCPMTINGRGELSIAESLPPYVEAARMGAYRCCQTTAVNTVQAVPTTTAQVTLWNGEPDNRKSYVLHSVSTIVAASSFGGGLNVQLVGCLNARKNANPAGTLLTIRGTAGQQYLGRGVVALARTITNDGWFPLGQGLDGTQLTTAAYGMVSAVLTYYAQGSIILLPGYLFSISVVTTAGAGLCTVRSGLRWQEVTL